ncbi:exo-beta-N-acetylmuramidase NamZ family protein [Pelosinus propionicus]|uniref:Uncharacterized conserved protein YbbC, DUF1343 family n=1 Tax=Pelosinus propionicus DSM 13327 TaxID=1123291 RepID=A0A1I4HMD1_9FIRM|nr:DUF1343 domain-containing protein [Pelosinus propionicus]SFL42867.1 Uncharacterized conserved protein YbbC, DUF1343 family [Pelosinus propionicus DSM 13327]
MNRNIAKGILLFMVFVIGMANLLSIGETKKQARQKNNLETNQSAPVRLGIDRIDEYLHIFTGKRVGLITNSTGMNSSFQSSVDVLHEKTNLVALFSPEHGIRGAVKAGDSVNTSVDEKTKLPIYSLYGATKKPTPEMLADIDVLVFDIQDVGARSYTYIYTMAYAMQACKELGKTMVIFDRPNPIGGAMVEGNLVKPGFESFIGMYPIPTRHGMTVGELARLFNAEFGIGCDLVVIEMTGWQRKMNFEETHLPWVMTSPNIPTPDTAIVYPGTGIFGGTNISEGVGTTRPFEFVGAPWINAYDLAAKMTALQLPGVIFRPVYFTPNFGLYQNEPCAGVQLHVIDKSTFLPVKTGISLLYTIQEMSGDRFSFTRNGKNESSIDLITGDDDVRKGTYTLNELYSLWEKETNQFKAMSKKYYLYE